ncbi:hypothetical protein ACTA71_000148 [Dictyostelium dimigraforme]
MSVHINDILLNQESLQNKNKYTCPICFEFIYKKSIYQCKSGHFACKQCWERSLESKQICMTCSCEIKSINDLSRNLVIERDFGKKKTYCIYSFTDETIRELQQNNSLDGENKKTLIKDEVYGCKDVMMVDQLDSHFQNCKFKFESCPHQGCKIILRKHSLEEHDKQCGFKLVKCGYCERGDIEKNQFGNHKNECPKVLIDCPLECSMKIERDQTQSHLENYCINKIMECKYFQYGCKVQMKRSEVQKHLENVNHQFFMGFMIEKQFLTLERANKTIEELQFKMEESNKTQNEKNKQYEKIQEQLFKTIEKLNLALDKAERNQEENQLKMEQLNITILEKIILHEISQENLQKECNILQKMNNDLSSKITKNHETYITKQILSSSLKFNSPSYKNKWILSNFSKFTNCFESPIFQLYSNRFCILIYPNGGMETSKLSLYLNCEHYSEAIKVEFFLKLVNVLDKSKSIKTNPKIYKYLSSDKYGWPSFLSTELITVNNGWLSKDGKLIIKVYVKILNNSIKPLES